MTNPTVPTDFPAPGAKQASARTNSRFIIEGGNPIAGTVRAAANKNAALPIVAGCLLATEPVVLHDVPDIVDVILLIELLDQAGCTVERLGPNSWKIDASAGVDPTHLDPVLCERIRGSLLLAGPLVRATARSGFPSPAATRSAAAASTRT